LWKTKNNGLVIEDNIISYDDQLKMLAQLTESRWHGISEDGNLDRIAYYNK